MDVPRNIKRFAKENGFPKVDFLMDWKGFPVYTAFDPDFPYVGLPQYIISETTANVRWATMDETEEIMLANR